jgi:hypothetical protein
MFTKHKQKLTEYIHHGLQGTFTLFLKGMLGGPTALFESRSEAMAISDAGTVGDTLSLSVCVI